MLPSRTVPYQVKQINVNPFRPKQLGLLSKAVFLESMDPAIDAMQEVCDFDVRLMTPGDFYYLLAWQRFNSLKREVSANWECEGTAFRRVDTGEVYRNDRIVRITEGWNAAEGTPEQAQLENPNEIEFNAEYCGSYNIKPITFEDFTTVFLPETKLDPRLDYPRVMHMVEYDTLVVDPVYSRIAGPARWVAAGRTLKEKIDILFAQETMDLFEAAAQANATIMHGISRTLRKNCDKCGSSHTFQTSIEPASFFV